MKTLLLLASLVFVAGCHWPKSEISTNKHQAGMAVLISSHTLSIKADAGKIHWVTDGEIGLPSGGTDPSGLMVLKVGDRTVQKPDHHSFTMFEVAEIKEKSVVMDYEYKFNHGPFGKNVITIDRGQVEVDFKE